MKPASTTTTIVGAALPTAAIQADRLTARLVAVAEETMQPQGAGLWVRGLKR